MLTRLVKINDDSLREAASAVKLGKLVAYPTDTVYGLGCNPFNPAAVDRLVRVKNRIDGSLPILVEGLEAARRIGLFNSTAETLATKFWPGPLTIVVPAATRLPAHVTASDSSVGLRVPGRADTLQLIRQSGGCIVGTSANISGKPASKTADEAMRQLKGRIELVLDGGTCIPGVESTIVKIETQKVSVLREKAIGREKILETLRTQGQ